MKMLRSVICVALLSLQLSPSVGALLMRGSVLIGPNLAQSGVNLTDLSLIPFVNFFKMSSTFQTYTGTTCIYPNNLLQGSNLPNGTLPCNLTYTAALPQNYTGKHVLSYTGTLGSGGLQLDLNSFRAWGTVYSVTGGSISGCTNSNVPPCQFDTTGASRLTISGTNPVVTFDLSNPITGAVNNGSGLVRISVANTNISNVSTVTVTGVVGSDGNGCGANGQWGVTNVTTTTADLVGSTFSAGCTYTSGGQIFPYNQNATYTLPWGYTSGTVASNMTSLVLCKLADYNADNTCNTTSGHATYAGGFNDDFVASLATLHVHHTRFLDVSGVNNAIPADWNGWQTTSAFSYNVTGTQSGDFWAISNWFGSASGTNSYSISCANGTACTYKLTGGAPVDGDFVQFYNTNANTSANPTLTITDASSVTSSAIPIFNKSGNQLAVVLGGTTTAGDTISLTFNTTPLGAYTCLSGGTHTTSAYTVLNTDTSGSIANAIFAIVSADSTLTALPADILAGNGEPGSGTFWMGYANNACTLSVTANITGSATETVTIGPMWGAGGTMVANTLYTAVYNSYLKAFLINTGGGGGLLGAWPWSVQIALSQAVSRRLGLQVGCWLQIPLLWSNASFTSLANYAAANQCQGETITEVGNEVWNPGFFQTAQAKNIANSIGVNGSDAIGYLTLKSRQLAGIGSSAFGGIAGNYHPVIMFQLGGASTSELNGTHLCGNSACANSNYAYDNAVGVNYNASPNRPIDYTRHIGDAPYYQGSILNSGYFASTSYGSWSATSSSVASNVLTVSGTVTGTIWWNQGIAGCDGAYIAAPTASSPTGAQLTGTVSTTLNGSVGFNTTVWNVTSTTGLSAGMWVYNQTTGMINGVISSVNSGTQITITGTTYPSSGSNDTIVFGGKTGTYRLNTTSCSIASGTITGGDVLGFQYAVDNYCTASGTCSTGNVGLGSVQDAYNWAYQDTLVSARNNSMQTDITIQSLAYRWNLIDTVAAAEGVTVWDYEGGYQGIAPSTSQATSMGLPSSSYGGSAGYSGLFLTAWKNSSSFKSLETARHTNELAALPANSQTMWYVDSSNGQWGLYSTGLYGLPPFQSYNAICNYNGGSC